MQLSRIQVTSHRASQLFHDKIQAKSKKIVLFPVRLQTKCRVEIFISFEQGGYHELQNEPDGVKEKLLEEVVSFIDDHLASFTPAKEAQADSESPASGLEITNPELTRDSTKAKM